jgi:hypothetical protein
MKFGMNMRGGMNMHTKELLTNKTVLIIITILAVLNLVGYMMYNMTHLLIIFGIIAGLTYVTSEHNMTLTLGVPLVAVNILVVLHNKYGIMRGLEGMDTMDASGGLQSSSPKKAAAAVALANHVKKNDDKGMNNKHALEIHHYDEGGHSASGGDSSSGTDDQVEAHTEEAFGGKTKNGKYRVDYASTIQDAYDELNTVLGSGGIKNLTADTQNLVKQQLQLAETMKTMGPLVQSMGPLLKQVQGLMGSSGMPPGVK